MNIVNDLAIASRIGAPGAKDAALISLDRCQRAEIANAAAENIPRSPTFVTLGPCPFLNVKGKFRRLDGWPFASATQILRGNGHFFQT